MSHTRGDILQMISARDILDELARAYFWARFANDLEWQTVQGAGALKPIPWERQPSIESIDIDENEVTIVCEASACRCGCCGYHRRTYTFPTTHLEQDPYEILADLPLGVENE